MKPRSTARGDEGVTLILVALAMTALLLVVAIVIDLGYQRGSARKDQSIADFAALAGGDLLEDGNYIGACQEMIRYLNGNATGMPAIDATSMCSELSTSVCMSGTSLAAPTRDSGKFTVSVELPVPDESGAYPALGSGVEDGEPCARMRVTVTSTDPAFFGGIVDKTEHVATRSATVRAAPGEQQRSPALWLLEPTGCTALEVNGSSTSVVVGDMAAVPPIPGLIAVDSDGTTCSSNQYTVKSAGTLHGLSTMGDPLGEIKLYALPRGATGCSAPSCDPADVAGGRLLPQPVPAGRRATRAPVDWKWNCKGSYPSYYGIPIPACPLTAERAPYLDNLEAAIGASGTPTGYQRFRAAGHSCNNPGNLTLTGNWHIDCALRVSNGNSVTISGGNVVADGAISTSGNGVFAMNTANPGVLPGSCLPPAVQTPCLTDSSADAAFLYLRSGGLDISGSLDLRRTAVYLAAADGILNVSANTGSSLVWTAPRVGPLSGLAVWAENDGVSTNAHKIAGGGGALMSGSFFTPYANSMSLTGGSGMDLRGAQFISQTLVISGGSTLQLAPSSVEVVTLPPMEALLIR